MLYQKHNVPPRNHLLGHSNDLVSNSPHPLNVTSGMSAGNSVERKPRESNEEVSTIVLHCIHGLTSYNDGAGEMAQWLDWECLLHSSS